MPINAFWDSEDDSLLWCEYVGDWTWDEFQAMVSVTSSMISAVPHPVYVISDVRRSGPIPINMAIFHIMSALKRTPDNHDISILLGPDHFLRLLISTLLKFIKKSKPRICIVDTLEQARAIIADERVQV